MPALENPQREALARHIAGGEGNMRAAALAAGYSRETAARRAHLLARDPEVLARVAELRGVMVEAFAQAAQAIQQQQQPAQVQPAQAAQPEPAQAAQAAQAQPEPAPQAEPAEPRRLTRAERSEQNRAAHQAERSEQNRAEHRADHSDQNRAEHRESQQSRNTADLQWRQDQIEILRQRAELQARQVAAPPVLISARPGAHEPVLVRVENDVRYAVPSTQVGLGDISDLTPEQKRAWLERHLGAIAVEARLRGDRRAAISAADGLAKVNGLQTQRVEVTHRSVLDGLSVGAMQQLLAALDAARHGDIEFVPATVLGDDDDYNAVDAPAACMEGEACITSNAGIDPLS